MSAWDEVSMPLQAYPTKSELAKAIRGQLGTAAGSKKLSRLKRVILRERSDKAAAAAAAALEAANVTAEQTQAARAQVLTSFKVGVGRQFWICPDSPHHLQEAAKIYPAGSLSRGSGGFWRILQRDAEA